MLVPVRSLKFMCFMQGLFRSAQHVKQAEFLGRDFSTVKACEAACKNAFVLLGQHRYELAAAFFVLGECTAASNTMSSGNLDPGFLNQETFLNLLQMEPHMPPLRCAYRRHP